MIKRFILLAALSVFGFSTNASADWHGGGYYPHYPHDRFDLVVAESYPAYSPAYAYPAYSYYPAPTYAYAPPPQPVSYADTGNNRYCREYTNQMVVAGQVQRSYGTACMQPDGTWQIVN